MNFIIHNDIIFDYCHTESHIQFVKLLPYNQKQIVGDFHNVNKAY